MKCISFELIRKIFYLRFKADVERAQQKSNEAARKNELTVCFVLFGEG